MANAPRYRGSVPDSSNSEARVREAWRLHRWLMLGQAQDPLLCDDELFRVFCAEAYARFEGALEGRA